MTLIKREDAIKIVDSYIGTDPISDRIKALPSAEAKSDDLIIKGAKGIKDGLYNIKDRKLFQYKANGGTVRTYPIVEALPSAEAIEVVRCKDCKRSDWYKTLNGEHRCYCMEHGSSGHTEDDYCSYGEREESEVE